MAEEFRVLLQAVIAIALGGLVGWEREQAGKWAGLRTHMLVAMAALLFIRLGQLLIPDTGESGRDLVQADPSRIIEAIVAGISFLGAGTIMRDRTKGKARGLTTAASLLLTATIGISVALDRYIIAIGSAILSLIILRVFNKLEDKITPAGSGKNEAAGDSNG